MNLPVRTCCDAAQESECSLWHNTCLDMQMGERACLSIGYIWNKFICSIWLENMRNLAVAPILTNTTNEWSTECDSVAPVALMFGGLHVWLMLSVHVEVHTQKRIKWKCFFTCLANSLSLYINVFSLKIWYFNWDHGLHPAQHVFIPRCQALKLCQAPLLSYPDSQGNLWRPTR